ncbi:MAG: glycosyltransferase, partial [Bacteroidetes bacterium]|nr:glycosyltransferase [Bacteroidota bacterium]
MIEEKYKKAKMLLLITKADDYSDSADCSGQTVLLDALASGLPIIASRKEYLKDYVKEGKDVYLVDFYDAYGIKKAINIMDSDNEKRLNMAKEARQTVQNRFSTEHMAEALSSVFEKTYER